MAGDDTNCAKGRSCCGTDNSAESGNGLIVLRESAKPEVVTTLRVSNMDCADEVAAIKAALARSDHVRELKVNLISSKVTVAHEKAITGSDLIQLIGSAGLKATLFSDASVENVDAATTRRHRFASVALSGFLTGLGLAVHAATDLPILYIRVIFALAVVSGAWFIVPKAIRAARSFRLDMNVLMTVAVAGAAIIGEWSEAATVTFLFALAELLEAYSVDRARRAVKSLLKLAPPTALIKRSAGLEEVPVETVAVGETMLIRTGAKIPLDGEVASGRSTVNQAPITGESMPVDKGPGDTVFAGTLNGEGSLEVRVTKPYSDTTLSKIIHLIEEAQGQKAASERFVDKFARIYTPAVFVLALLILFIPPLFLGGSWDRWIYRSLVLLVIACPCALVISTPVSVVSGLTAMARRGVLIKGGVFLEAIGRLQALAVDKTGTITEGRPRVVRVIAQNGHTEDQVLSIAAAIDHHSDHPLARAIVDEAERRKVNVPVSTGYRAVTGRGAEAHIHDQEYFIGNHAHAHELGVCTPGIEDMLKSIESEALSVAVLGRKAKGQTEGSVLGVMAVGDTVRQNASIAIQALHRAGVKQVVMLSGDNQRTVTAIAKAVGIDQAVGDLLPQDKTKHVKALTEQYRFVGMVGDGVNDAPAMATATVGIAMGAAGTDTAIETADIALMKDDLMKVAEAVLLGRKTVRIIKSNIAFALLVKAIFLVLAVAGVSSLWLAILADTGATLIVIANALRLLGPRTETEQ